MRKAQEGKVVGTGKAPYGFYYADDHYHIDPERMPYVHKIFEMIADGHSIYEVAQHLRGIGAPSPRGAVGKWGRTTIRNIILSETYLGTYWWGREKRTTTTVSVIKDGERTYKKKVVTEPRPQSEWIAIPVPDSGVPAETVARARDSLKGNVKAVSKNSDRTWELSGGVGVCSECGRRMVAHTVRNPVKKRYFYYRCSNRERRTCSNRKLYPAGKLEIQVKDIIVETFQPETWAGFVDDLCDIQLADLRNLHRAGPKETRENLARRMDALETKISRARDLFIDGDLPRLRREEDCPPGRDLRGPERAIQGRRPGRRDPACGGPPADPPVHREPLEWSLQAQWGC